jgi:hypothetical protein
MEVFMKKLLILATTLILSINVQAKDISYSCGSAKGGKAELTIHPSVSGSTVYNRCIKWEIVPGCSQGYNDDAPSCVCLESKTISHDYNTWLLNGTLKIDNFNIEIETEINGGGTQSDIFENIHYVANFVTQDPRQDLEIRLQRLPVGSEYKDVLFNLFTCVRK